MGRSATRDPHRGDPHRGPAQGTRTGDPHRGPTQRGGPHRGPTTGGEGHTGDPHRTHIDNLYIYSSIYLSIYLSIHPSIYLSIYLYCSNLERNDRRRAAMHKLSSEGPPQDFFSLPAGC